MNVYDILVNSGFSYVYYGTIRAKSVFEARAKWKARGDWMSEDFKVRKIGTIDAL